MYVYIYIYLYIYIYIYIFIYIYIYIYIYIELRNYFTKSDVITDNRSIDIPLFKDTIISYSQHGSILK